MPTATRRLVNLLMYVGETELQIEFARQKLCKAQHFEAYAAFKRVDRREKNYLEAGDVYRYMKTSGYSVQAMECHHFIKFFDSTLEKRLYFSDFLQVLLPCDNNQLRCEVTQREPYEVLPSQSLSFDLEKLLSKLIYQELLFARKQESLKQQLKRAPMSDLQGLFDEVDIADSTYIDRRNLKAFLLRASMIPNDNLVLAIIRRTDLDCDAKLSFMEFVEAVRPVEDQPTGRTKATKIVRPQQSQSATPAKKIAYMNRTQPAGFSSGDLSRDPEQRISPYQKSRGRSSKSPSTRNRQQWQHVNNINSWDKTRSPQALPGRKVRSNSPQKIHDQYLNASPNHYQEVLPKGAKRTKLEGRQIQDEEDDEPGRPPSLLRPASSLKNKSFAEPKMRYSPMRQSRNGGLMSTEGRPPNTYDQEQRATPVDQSGSAESRNEPQYTVQRLSGQTQEKQSYNAGRKSQPILKSSKPKQNAGYQDSEDMGQKTSTFATPFGQESPMDNNTFGRGSQPERPSGATENDISRVSQQFDDADKSLLIQEWLFSGKITRDEIQKLIS